ncbi:MAG: hypothetical protein QM504_10035 [Pseudomonadota bacterium]
MKTLILFTIMTIISNSQAQLIAYDGFDYSLDDSLTGLDGGSGWATAWTSNSGSGKIVSGLNYSDANGNQLVREGNAYEVNPSIFFYQTLRDTTTTFGTGGTTVWLSFIIQQANVSTGTNYATVTLGTGFTFDSNAMIGGIGGNPSHSFIGNFYGSSGGVSDLSNTLGLSESTFLVLRFDFSESGNDSLSLWFNPILDNTIGDPLLTYSGKNYAEMISGITIAHGDFRNFVYDEIRIGIDYASVSPIRANLMFKDGFE